MTAPIPMTVSSERSPLEKMAVTAIRTLAMDAVQKANSGHPGTPVAMAPVIYTLWQRFLRFDPSDPIWPNRDRFVLSMGHASMLLYSMLHLTKVKSVNAKYETLGRETVTLDDIKTFRQLDSRCAGHPEYRWTSGVETTTGPLGNGVATSVGMAMASKWLAATYNRPDFTLFDHDVYAMCGDGCMMEGISHEAASLAGHLRLANLCWIYDNNHITIEGATSVAFSEDVATRFIVYGWNVTRVGDANDLEMLARAFNTFKATTDRPTLIIVDSHIAWGVPGKEGSHTAHGEPLGWKAICQAKEFYGCKFKDGPPPPTPRMPRMIAGKSGCSRIAWPTASTTFSPTASANAARACATPGSPSWPSTRPSIRKSGCSSTRSRSASCPTAGTRTSSRSQPTPRAWAGASRRKRSST